MNKTFDDSIKNNIHHFRTRERDTISKLEQRNDKVSGQIENLMKEFLKNRKSRRNDRFNHRNLKSASVKFNLTSNDW